MPDNIQWAIAVAKRGKDESREFQKDHAILCCSLERKLQFRLKRALSPESTSCSQRPNSISTRVPKQYYGNEVCLWYSDEKVDTDFARIMAVSSVMIGIDQETYESAPYKEQFFVAFG
jgi:hypothetical protein